MEEKQIKKCPRCGRELPLEEFNKCSKSKDGRQYSCKDCQREAMRKSYRKEKGMAKVYNNPELAKFQPRELIAELRARGYSGELSFTQRITVQAREGYLHTLKLFSNLFTGWRGTRLISSTAKSASLLKMI